jgi:sigma-E factor negative regulatory protein RseA
MSHHIEEQLSAFMDGELGRDEARFLLRRVQTDAELAGRWSRYHIARQALRRENIVVLRKDFSSALMARLDAEAAPRTSGHAWLRWGSGGAIAAAVAVAALIVTKPADEPERAPAAVAANAPRATQAAPAQVVSTSPMVPAPLPLVPNSPIQTAAASFGTDLAEPVSFDPRLQSYVIRHYQATGAAGQPDFVPYILLAQPVQTLEPRQAENR